LHAKKPLPEGYPKQLKTIGDHLLKRRLDLRLQQKAVAKKLQVTPGTLQNWEKSQNVPDIRLYPRIIEFLGYIPFDTGCKNLSERIVLERKLLGLTQEEFAHQAGLSIDVVKSWENGKHRPNRHLLQILASFFVCGKPVKKVYRSAKTNKPLLTDCPAKPKFIGDHIKKRRLELGMSRKDLADKLGITFYAVRGWEYEQKSPSAKVMPRIIEFLGYVP
jgi:transcriptional regulator with XRE-family HTH domain